MSKSEEHDKLPLAQMSMTPVSMHVASITCCRWREWWTSAAPCSDDQIMKEASSKHPDRLCRSMVQSAILSLVKGLEGVGGGGDALYQVAAATQSYKHSPLGVH